MITRAQALAMTSGAALARALSLPASAQANRPLSLGVLPVEAAAGAYYATQLGSFTKAGLDVTLTSLGNTPSIVAAVVGGSLDIGYTTIDSVASIHAHGVQLVVIAPATDYIDPLTTKTAGILVRPDSPMPSRGLECSGLATHSPTPQPTTGSSRRANGSRSQTRDA